MLTYLYDNTTGGGPYYSLLDVLVLTLAIYCLGHLWWSYYYYYYY